MMIAEKDCATDNRMRLRDGVVSGCGTGSEKITAEHLDKLAVVYVRQSSQQQVLENRESTARQYALADYAELLGWPAERILLIDEDQGQSGASAEHRSGFQRLLAEVTMDHVGLVLGLEMSRLARSSQDWHQLFELCGIFNALLADQDGIYTPNDPNDRLLLGLKGIISEVELQTMRNRLERGRMNKAQRGELFHSVPFGYVILPDGKVGFDPNEQAQSVVRMLFDKFDDLGTIRSLTQWLLNNDIRLPIRPRGGANKGELEWRRANQHTLQVTLHHPIYAGAYSYGRRQQDSKPHPVTGKRGVGNWLPMEQWKVLILDHLPAYIPWQQYLNNQQQLKQNQTRPDSLGAPRDGSALLCGLLICGHCHWRMAVNYRVKDHPYYRCMRHHSTREEDTCFGLSANVLDEHVAGQLLRALEPASLELAIAAQSDLARESERLKHHWQQKLKRSQYDVELAQRRYHAVDPENRLVAGTLEKAWEDALREDRELKEEYDRFSRQTLATLSSDREMEIRKLSADIPALWNSPSTNNIDRQAILRCLVERIVVSGNADHEKVEATIHWVGGFESRIAFARPVKNYDQLSDRRGLLDRIVALRESGQTAKQMAEVLNSEGYLPIDPRKSFTQEIVRDLLLKMGLRGEQHDATQLSLGEWWLRDLADELQMAWQTLREWATRGWIRGRQSKVQKLWILWADEEEIARLRKLKAAAPRGTLGYPLDLTTPKCDPAIAAGGTST